MPFSFDLWVWWGTILVIVGYQQLKFAIPGYCWLSLVIVGYQLLLLVISD